MTETVLFIGGRANGQRKLLSDSYTTFTTMHPVPEMDGYGCFVEYYHREIISYGGKQYPVYLSENEDRVNLIPLLIKGYRNAK